MNQGIVFNRMEAAGSLGDLGTLLPIATAMAPEQILASCLLMGFFCSSWDLPAPLT